jgi:hypothetical protein
MTQKCAQVGPRGGRCRRNAQMVKDSTLDFCQPHNQMVRDGVKLDCARCGAMVTAWLQLV